MSLLIVVWTGANVCISDDGAFGVGNPIERLRAEGIRAKSRGDVEKMEAAGFNLVLPWGGADT